MTIKIFLLGRPGSGKSTTAKHFEEISLKTKGWVLHRFNDHPILEQMLKSGDNRIAPDGKGFIVNDDAAFKDALKQLNKNVKGHLKLKLQNEIVVIEFARSNYTQAMKLFSKNVVKGAYCICIDTDIPVCITRTRERAVSQADLDNHPISVAALNRHYGKQKFPSQKDISNIWILNNQGGWEEFCNKVDPVINDILKEV